MYKVKTCKIVSLKNFKTF